MIWLLRPRNIFSLAVLASGIFLVHRWTRVIASSSMEPALSRGAVVIFARIQSERYRAGDIIVFKDERGLDIVHRIVGEVEGGGGRQYITMGDANIGTREFVPIHRIEGRVFLSLPPLGKLVR